MNNDSSGSLPFDSFSEQARIPLNPAIIRERLHQLWERSMDSSAESSTDSSADSSKSVSHTRISLANLVVLAGSESRQAAETLIVQFAQQRPSRTILVTFSPTESSSNNETNHPPSVPLEAEVAIACNIGSLGSGMLCWEKITVETESNRAHQIPNVIRALASGMKNLVLVDLTKEKFSSEVNAEFSRLADYHFFDSNANRRKLSQHLKSEPEKLAGVFDLSYERSHPLREAIKYAFDDSRALDRVAKLKEITVSLSSGSMKQERRVFAYLSGWLAAKLRLEPAGEPQRRRIEFLTTDNLQLTIRACDIADEAHELEIEFIFDDPNFGSLKICSEDFLTVSSSTTSEYHFKIVYNNESPVAYSSPCLSDAGYILRRLSDVRRRSDFTDSLQRTKTLLESSAKEKIT